VAKPYSSDENCLHISYEAGKLETSCRTLDLVEFGMTVSPQRAPDEIENVKIVFEAACRQCGTASGSVRSRSFRR